jgi:RNA polymerase primary sigma factor
MNPHDSHNHDCMERAGRPDFPPTKSPFPVVPRGLEDSAMTQELQGTDDPLAIYLKEICKIPPLTLDEEIALAKRIEFTRQRFRRRVLGCPYALCSAIQTLKRVESGGLSLARALGFSTKKHLEYSDMLQRLPQQLRSLERLMEQIAEDFIKACEPGATKLARNAARRLTEHRRHKMVALVEAYPIRIEKIQRLMAHLGQISERMDELERWIRELSVSDIQANLEKELRDLMQITAESPTSLQKRVEIVRNRFAQYEDAKRALSGGNLQLVVHIAEKHRVHGLGFFDLFQTGNNALMLATDTFDLRCDGRFGEYASLRIEKAITDAIEERNSITLSRPIGGNEDSYLGNLVEDATCESTDNALTPEMLKDKIRNLLRRLTYREREIIKFRYGLGDGYTYAVEEVARIFQITRKRVRQIEAKALRKLEHPARSRQLEESLDSALQDKTAGNCTRFHQTRLSRETQIT